MTVVPLPDLETVVTQLDRVTSPLGFDLRPHLLFVEGDPGDTGSWEFGFVDVDGESVSLALLGFTAPATRGAIGSLTGGWGRSRHVRRA
ncbi:MAG: hypothetical protein ACRD0U_03690 [Acidimicrobiales bacterium]